LLPSFKSNKEKERNQFKNFFSKIIYDRRLNGNGSGDGLRDKVRAKCFSVTKRAVAPSV